METDSDKVLGEAISEKKISVNELMRQLSETGAALWKLLSCRPAVQLSLSAFQRVEDPERRFWLLAGLECLLEECLREVQSIFSKAHGEERKRHIARKLYGARVNLSNHQRALKKSAEHEPKLNDSPNEAAYIREHRRWSEQNDEHKKKVWEEKDRIGKLEEERGALDRGESPLPEEERKLLASAYDAAIAETRSHMEILLNGAESDDAVVQVARSAANAAIGNIRRRCGKKPI